MFQFIKLLLSFVFCPSVHCCVRRNPIKRSKTNWVLARSHSHSTHKKWAIVKFPCGLIDTSSISSVSWKAKSRAHAGNWWSTQNQLCENGCHCLLCVFGVCARKWMGNDRFIRIAWVWCVAHFLKVMKIHKFHCFSKGNWQNRAMNGNF